MRIRLVVGTLALLAVVGCSADGPASSSRAPTSSAQAPSTSATPSPSEAGSAGADPDTRCNVITRPEMTALAGGDLAGPSAGQVGGLPACQWGTPDGVGVQVITQPAGRWARSLPGLVDQLQKAGLMKDPESRRKLARARDLVRSGSTVAPQQACRLFSLLVEVQGQPPGSDSTVNVVPSRQDPQAVTGQVCSQGRYTSVLLVAPDLTGSEQEAARVRTALDAVHRRSLAGTTRD